MSPKKLRKSPLRRWFIKHTISELNVTVKKNKRKLINSLKKGIRSSRKRKKNRKIINSSQGKREKIRSQRKIFRKIFGNK